MTSLDWIMIARVAHEVNRAYCQAIGDNSQKPWEEAPQWQRDSALSGVRHLAADPKIPPSVMHEHWAAQKRAEGWTYGETKDPEKKTHPCLVPFSDLPEKQRAKDYIFAGVVRALL